MRRSRRRSLTWWFHDREQDVADALHAGALGYALKWDEPDAFLDAVRAAARNERFLSVALRRELVEKATEDPSQLLALLSPREREVFVMVARDSTNQQISDALGISPKTVDTHRTRLYRKLGCQSVIEIARFAVMNGLITVAEAQPLAKASGPENR